MSANNYEIAWKKLRMYVEGLPHILDMLPVPPEVIKQVAHLDTANCINAVSRVSFHQILKLMQEQESELGLRGLDSDDRGIMNAIANASPTDTLQDLINAIGKPVPTQPQEVEAPDLEAYANDLSAKERESTLIPATEEAAYRNYQHMQALNSSRALVVVPAKNGYPVMGCLFVAGERELERLMGYAQDGHKMTYDSRLNNDQGEN